MRCVEERLLDDLLIFRLARAGRDESFENMSLKFVQRLSGARNNFGDLRVHQVRGGLEGLLLGLFERLLRRDLLQDQGLLEL